MSSAPDVSVIVVNHNSGGYLPGCVESLVRQELGEHRLEILVVDCASTQDQEQALEAARACGARVLESTENLGYGGGCNRGLAATGGRFVFFLNADTVACPGALRELVEYLASHPNAGCVEPRTYLDDERAFRVPEFFLLDRRGVVLEALGRVSGRIAEAQGRRRLERMLPGWRTETPHAQEALTGAFLGARREVLERLDGFDAAYPLAYEDHDLFRRLSAAGFELVLVPGAEAIHYAHRSRVTDVEAALSKSRAGRRRYLLEHFGRAALALDAVSERVAGLAARFHAARPPAPVVRLDGREPPVLELERSGPFLLQLSLDPFFLVAAGHFGEGRSFVFPRRTWASLLPARYWLRALDPETLAPKGRWSVEKGLASG